MAESHYCVIHKTAFFMKGKMKGYAHPITDAEGQTIGWCNEGDVEKLKDLPPQEPGILPEHQAVIEEAMEEGYKKMAQDELTTIQKRTREEDIDWHVCFKELGEAIRVDKVPGDKPTQDTLKRFYWAHIYDTLRISFEKKKDA